MSIIFIHIILVPSLEFAPLDEYEQQLLSFNSDKMTLETYLQIRKQCLIQISRHPVIEIKDNYCLVNSFFYLIVYCKLLSK